MRKTLQIKPANSWERTFEQEVTEAPFEAALAAAPSPGKRAKQEGLQLVSLSQVLRELHIVSWDWLIWGDGSGTTWERACGWGVWMLRRGDPQPQALHGSLSHGTNIVSEVLPYLHALLYLASRQSLLGRRLHLISDCELVSDWGQKRSRCKAYRPLWLALESFQEQGALLTYHWLRRETSAANRFCHQLANLARCASQSLPAGIESLPAKREAESFLLA